MAELDQNLKRNTSGEVTPQGYSDELGDYKTLQVDGDGHQKISGMGEVSATPTLNTVLGRLKSLEDKIDLVTDSGNLKVSQCGHKTAPATGTKTVTSTAAEIFAGTSRKTGRSMIYIRNNHDSIAIRIGASDITDTKGRRVLPQTEEKIEFNPLFDVSLYAISEFGNVEAEVFEV